MCDVIQIDEFCPTVAGLESYSDSESNGSGQDCKECWKKTLEKENKENKKKDSTIKIHEYSIKELEKQIDELEKELNDIHKHYRDVEV